jgi:hypothetical protein
VFCELLEEVEGEHAVLLAGVLRQRHEQLKDLRPRLIGGEQYFSEDGDGSRESGCYTLLGLICDNDEQLRLERGLLSGVELLVVDADLLL